MPKVDPEDYKKFKKGMFGDPSVTTEEEMSIQDVIERLRKKAQELIKGDSDKEQPTTEEQGMDTEYKNKLLQISYKDSAKQKEGPEARRAGIRRLLQKMQEGPVPDMNTDKEVPDERENAILRQVEGLEEEETSAKPRKKNPLA